MKEIDLVYRTIFAELTQRCLDGSFVSEFAPEGRFVSVPVKGKRFWYYDGPQDRKQGRLYVGPQTDPEITRRVEAFRDIKDSLKARRKLVSTLVREAGLPAAERLTGDVVEVLASAGLFRLRGVLIGTVAFQCYSGLLGLRLPAATMQTSDADFAQFHAVSVSVRDTMPPMLDTIKTIDPSFREVPHRSGGLVVTAYKNRVGFHVEFLTPNRGSDDHDSKPASMPALGGASAEPLRFLDFLIREPVRSVMLHSNGVAVTVPAPERYAVHKLIVASRRNAGTAGAAKRSKDVEQAASLIEALSVTRRHADLAFVFREAWKRGRAWREAIKLGLSYLPEKKAAEARAVLAVGLQVLGETPGQIDLLIPPPA